MSKANEVLIQENVKLTLEEVSEYSGIGVNKLREITNQKNCNFVIFIGAKRLIKRKPFEKYIESISVL